MFQAPARMTITWASTSARARRARSSVAPWRGARNVISANDSEGIYISGSSDNVIQGNFIGTDVTGTAALGNTPPGYLGSGVMIDSYLFPATNNWIGGASAGARNIISGNHDTGIEFGYGPSNNVVQGNFIGTDVTGNKALGNVNDGILIGGATGTLIGGTNAGAGNVISANGGYGVDIQSGASGTVIQGNTIGLTFNSIQSPAKPEPLGKPRPQDGPVLVFLPDAGDISDYYGGPTEVGSPSPPAGNNYFGFPGNSYGIAALWSDPLTIYGNNYYSPGPAVNSLYLLNPNDPPPSADITSATYNINTGTVTVNGTVTGTPGDTIFVQIYAADPFLYTVIYNAMIACLINANGTGTFAGFLTSFPLAAKLAVSATDQANGTSEMGNLFTPTTSGTTPTLFAFTTANFDLSAWVGCPISTFTGELYESLPADLDLGGPLPLVFHRYYAAFIQKDGLVTGALGVNWLHNFEMTLTPTASNTVNVVNNRGRLIQFTNSAGVF